VRAEVRPVVGKQPDAKARIKKKFAFLKRSQHFILGSFRGLRGLITDVRVLAWLLIRRRNKAKYLQTHQLKKLQLGTSNNFLDGWLNTDVLPDHASAAYLDATVRFPFDDTTFDYIMAEHMIEDVEYQAAQFMLRECFRVLKPGGRVRFATQIYEFYWRCAPERKLKVKDITSTGLSQD